MASVLVVEDEVLLRDSLSTVLEAHGLEVTAVGSVAAARAELERGGPDLVLLDIRLPDASGLDLLKEIVEQVPQARVVMMTAYGTISDAVEAMRGGAREYLQKPLDLDELRMVVDRELSAQRSQRELDYHRRRGVPSGVVGSAPKLQLIFDEVGRLAAAGLPPSGRPPILLTGETGTGKGLIARAVHETLGGGPFIEVNCSAMPPALVESELFGHERGTFTDAKTARTGLFEAAAGGAIFLDEIGALQFDLQAKFLKVIEEKRVRRLGSNHDRPVDVHVIAATNHDLDRAVADGSFREDLLHRLRVLAFEVPPLRERPDDLPDLARHFCEELSLRYGRPISGLSPRAEECLAAYSWPGNVRELRNVLERAVLLARSDTLEVEDFAGLDERPTTSGGSQLVSLPPGPIELAEVERELIRQALDRTRGNRTKAAELLGLTRDTLRYRIEKFGIEAESAAEAADTHVEQ